MRTALNRRPTRSQARYKSKLKTLISQTKELFDFYANGAAVSPPEREADKGHWYDYVLVLGHVAASVGVGKLILAGAVASLPLALTAAAFVYLGHKAVDPVHGLVHFAIDNYFSRTTPIIGETVDGFLNHHDRPATISRIQFARNVAPLVMLSLPVLASLILIHPVGSIADVAALSFLGTFFGEIGFSMESHKYAHISPKMLPPALKWLQRREWLVPSDVHGKHHSRRPGYEADYAAVTGKSNRYLTSTFFRRTERAIYELTKQLTGMGIEPRSWRDPSVRKAALPEARGRSARAGAVWTIGGPA